MLAHWQQEALQNVHPQTSQCSVLVSHGAGGIAGMSAHKSCFTQSRAMQPRFLPMQHTTLTHRKSIMPKRSQHQAVWASSKTNTSHKLVNVAMDGLAALCRGCLQRHNTCWACSKDLAEQSLHPESQLIQQIARLGVVDIQRSELDRA